MLVSEESLAMENASQWRELAGFYVEKKRSERV